MNELEVRAILKDDVKDDSSISGEPLARKHYTHWETDKKEAYVNGHYTADELEALAWWMKHYET